MNTLDVAIKQIKEKGYYVIRSGFSEKVALDIKAELNRISDVYPPPVSSVPFLNSTSDLIYNPDHKSELILMFILRGSSFLHELLNFFLNDKWYRRLPEEDPNYILRASIARSSGNQRLPFHIDSFAPSSSKHVCVMQALFALDESSQANGATVIVPGSHRSDEYAIQDPDNVEAIILQPGDIAVWDSRLWHGALPNTSKAERWALVATFTRWWIKQNYQKPLALAPELTSKLTPQERTIMGFNSYPPFDEYERVDIKKGY